MAAVVDLAERAFVAVVGGAGNRRRYGLEGRNVVCRSSDHQGLAEGRRHGEPNGVACYAAVLGRGADRVGLLGAARAAGVLTADGGVVQELVGDAGVRVRWFIDEVQLLVAAI